MWVHKEALSSLDWFMKGLGIFGGIAADDDIDDPDAGCHQVSLDMGQDSGKDWLD
jgi:hypothetical protein